MENKEIRGVVLIDKGTVVESDLKRLEALGFVVVRKEKGASFSMFWPPK